MALPCEKELPIKLVSIGLDIIPYLSITISIFVLVGFVLKGISNLYVLLIAKILLSSILYILILLLLKSTILMEAISHLRRK